MGVRVHRPPQLRTHLSCIPLLPATGSRWGCGAAPHHPDLSDGARWPATILAAGVLGSDFRLERDGMCWGAVPCPDPIPGMLFQPCLEALHNPIGTSRDSGGGGMGDLGWPNAQHF